MEYIDWVILVGWVSTLVGWVSAITYFLYFVSDNRLMRLAERFVIKIREEDDAFIAVAHSYGVPYVFGESEYLGESKVKLWKHGYEGDITRLRQQAIDVCAMNTRRRLVSKNIDVRVIKPDGSEV